LKYKVTTFAGRATRLWHHREWRDKLVIVRREPGKSGAAGESVNRTPIAARHVRPVNANGKSGISGEEKLLRLLDDWMRDESGYDEKTWPALKHSLEEDRLSRRNRFRG
jgi:hypothetical protein